MTDAEIRQFAIDYCNGKITVFSWGPKIIYAFSDQLEGISFRDVKERYIEEKDVQMTKEYIAKFREITLRFLTEGK